MIAHRLPPGSPRKFESSEAMCRFVAQHTDVVVLAFSAGKDALSAWLQCRRFFKRVVPFYMYDVPDVPFVERNLGYYEDFFRTPILRYPSPPLMNVLEQGIYQPIHLWRLINDGELRRPRYDFEAILRDVMNEADARGTVLAEGQKVSDSLARAVSIKNHGALLRHRSKCFAVYDWNNDRMEREFRAENVKLASDYRVFVRTFEGARAAQLGPMKRMTPRSYEQLLKWMPLAPADLARREFFHREHLGESAYSHR